MRRYVSIILCVVAVLFTGGSYAKDFNIAVVDLNRALNESEKGIFSKNMLESLDSKLQQEVSAEEEDLNKRYQALMSNPLLDDKKKAEKQAELAMEGQKLHEKMQRYSRELRSKEEEITKNIFTDLKGSIRAVSTAGDYDLVLEKTASEMILFMKYDTVDITNKVIDHYNKLSNATKQE